MCVVVNFFIHRPIFASAIAIIMVLAGGICYFLLPVSQFPDITPPQVVVSAHYPGASAQVVADVRKHFGEKVYRTIVPRSVRLSEAPSFGKSILEYDATGVGANAYRALAREFIKRHSSPPISPEEAKIPASGVLGK